MSFSLIRAIARTENDDDIHLGRLLLLLLAANEKGSQSIDGITKLAKLDFLLRYPNCLERALLAEKRDVALAHVKDYERSTIESKMIRFKYGPWDSRYRRWLSLLASLSLIMVETQKKTIIIRLTEKGKAVAQQFSEDISFLDVYSRSQLVINTFGKMTPSGIKSFVYRVFPEIESLKWGEDIQL
jgi:hypothetical protein